MSSCAQWGINIGVAEVANIEKGSNSQDATEELSVRSVGIDTSASKSVGPVTLHVDTGYVRQSASVSRDASIMRLDAQEIYQLGFGISIAQSLGPIEVGAYLGGAFFGELFEFGDSTNWVLGDGRQELAVEVSIPDINNSEPWMPMGPLIRLGVSRQTYKTPAEIEYSTTGLLATLAWVFYFDEEL